MSFAQGIGFRACGSVVRRYVNPQGTFAAVTLDIFVDGRGKKCDFRAFKEVVSEVGELAQGQLVEFTGTVDREKLTAKDKTAVMVDGRECWIDKLTIKAIKVEASSKAATRPASTSTAPNPDGDQSDPTNW
jgi:hypothetical protein